MPITQTRMIALLRAGQDYQDALARLSNAIAQQAQQVALNRRTPQQAFELIAASSNSLILLSDPIQSSQTILAEAIHFRTHQAHNERKAIKMRENRELAYFGHKPTRPTTAPTRLDQPARLASTPAASPPTTAKDPDIDRIYNSTDGDQISSDSDLFNLETKLDQSVKDGVEQFLGNLPNVNKG